MDELESEDLLSEIVFSFFPGSNRNFDQSTSRILHDPTIQDRVRDTQWVDCGSTSENLMLPSLFDRKHGKIIEPDTDGMYNVFAVVTDEKLCMEPEQQQQVFCRIKHEENETITKQPIPDLINGAYLSSAAVKTFCEANGINSSPKTNAQDYFDITYKKDSTSSALSAYFTDEKGNKYSSDTVVCVKVNLDEEIKSSFMGRHNKNKSCNPVKNMEELLTENVYAIPKVPDTSEAGKLRWRLSFSVVEIQLALSVTELQRRCYKVLKALIKFDVNEDLQEDKKFPSYYLKTLLFWFCENTSKDSWTIQNLGRHWLKLLDSVIESLEEKTLPHYFVPSYNLLDGKAQDDIDCWLQGLKQLRQKPLEAIKKFWRKYELTNSKFWGTNFLRCLMNTECNKPKNSAILENIQLPNKIKELVCTTSSYLLNFNLLSDFILVLKHHPQMKQAVSAQAQPEHVIWTYYIELWSSFPTLTHGDNPLLWTYLAELVHHIVLKYGDQVEDKDLFNTRTAEWFHLLACRIQSTTHEENNRYDKVRYGSSHTKWGQ